MFLRNLKGVVASLVFLAVPGLGWGGQESAQSPATPREQKVETRHYRLEMNDGRGRGFCEALFKEAKRLHPTGEYRPLEPILAWNEIFGLPGVAEPPWTELDPLQHEALFQRLYALHELHSSPKPQERSNPVDRFFAGNRMAAICTPKPCVVPPLTSEERQQITLAAYRDFGPSGGRMRAYATDIGEAVARPVMVVQYEYATPPAWSFSYAGWFGLTFFAKSDLSDVVGPDTKNTVEAGLYTRLVLYREKPYLLESEAISILSVRYVLSPYWECRILKLYP